MKVLMRMRLAVACMMLVASVASWAQELEDFLPKATDSIDYVVEGVTEASMDSVSISSILSGETNWYLVEDGKFCIKGRGLRGEFMNISDKLGNNQCVIIDEEPIFFDMKTWNVTGSELNNRMNECERPMSLLERQGKELLDTLSMAEQGLIFLLLNGHRTVEESASLMTEGVERWLAMRQQYDAFRIVAMRTNVDNIIPALYLYSNYPACSYNDLSEFMREDAAYAHHPLMVKVWQHYKDLEKRQINRPFSDFEAEDVAGNLFRLSEYAGKGKYILLDFWASWCGPCMEEMPMLKELHAKYSYKGLQIIGVSCDEDREAWLSAIDRHSLPWLHCRDLPQQGDIKAYKLYGVSLIPNTVLISPNGFLIATDLLGKKLETKLQEIFGE